VSTVETLEREKAALSITAPQIAEHPHDVSLASATAIPDAAGVATTEAELEGNLATSPKGTAMPQESEGAPRDARTDWLYRSVAQPREDDPPAPETPSNEIPRSSMPVPGIGGRQASEADSSHAVGQVRSIYDQRGRGWTLPSHGSNATADMPDRMDASQPTTPPASLPPDPRTDFSLYESDATISPASPWARDRDPAHISKSISDRNETLISDEGSVEDEWPRSDAPDTLASALGHQSWPNRLVSYNVEVMPSLAPQNFWASLSEAATDSSLDYLREDEKPWWPLMLAMLALFASMGGNLYMGWIVAGIYRKYLALTDDLEDGGCREPMADELGEGDEWSPRRSGRQRESAGV